MATWMAHLRVADRLLDELDVMKTEFVVGNVAPDSGVPQDNGRFLPDKNASHFFVLENGIKVPDDAGFAEKYCKSASEPARSFYLGYHTHLMTDRLWIDWFVRELKPRDAESYLHDKVAAAQKWKKDWYDVDRLYLRENPDFRAFEIYKNAVGFENTYLDIFSPDAFDLKRQVIIDFYADPSDDLDREYVYLTPEDMDGFIDRAAEYIIGELK